MASGDRDGGDDRVAPERRRFLARVTLAAAAVGAALVGVPVIGLVLGPVLRRRAEVWRAVGAAARFQAGETVEVAFLDASPEAWAGVTARTAAWLRREADGSFTAFAINCTHLGCPVRWLKGAELFMCPCHGGVYYQDGTVAAGPPPRPLVRYEVRVRDGQVEIRTSGIPIT
ncbi:MAG TPA: Rieske 2Fe-2S domain-containing protein [Polyangia bacterium]|jgi:menaquinol-cytochrome c reductase iron-sulfur subunit